MEDDDGEYRVRFWCKDEKNWIFRAKIATKEAV